MTHKSGGWALIIMAALSLALSIVFLVTPLHDRHAKFGEPGWLLATFAIATAVAFTWLGISELIKSRKS